MADFLIIGAQKCGTTSVYNYLIQHPQIIPARRKEIHFFDLNYSLGIDWYTSQLNPLSPIERPNALCGEASPYYIFHPQVPARVYQHFPHVKLIVLLRNPVDRAISHYYHELNRLKTETLSFKDAIALESDRLQGELEKLETDSTYYSYNHQHYTYLSRGLYLQQLQRWMEFFPKEQFSILKSEDFWEKPDRALAQVLEFLQLPPLQLETYPTYNPGNYDPPLPSAKPGIWQKLQLWRQHLFRQFQTSSAESKRNFQPVSSSVRQQLKQYFQQPNQQLSDFLQRDFNW